MAISTGEPILRITVRQNMTYQETMEAYSNILKKLSENTKSYSSDYISFNPTIEIIKVVIKNKRPKVAGS